MEGSNVKIQLLIIPHKGKRKNVIADKFSRCFLITEEDIKDQYEDLIKKCAKRLNGAWATDNKDRIVVKGNKSVDLIKGFHKMIGHRGISVMYNNIKECLNIRNSISVLRKVANGCKICKKYKILNQKQAGKISMKAVDPFERISSDIFGPFSLLDFKTSGEGETGYVLSITDIYSRYTGIQSSISL
ncbi:hypothetical protein NGRA_3238 [Nosema granulosis]|uniref:Uncharacterized protein n=1 Tax=Nosema granulosis TaxID=83296 RepID=A0A9P6GXR3_9MICR|nr:hypothetical protein NGRA_3238 [Nosema granulosis]